MRILIIGGTAFIGPHVARELLEAGHAVTVFHRGHSEASLPGTITHIHGEQAKLGDHQDQLRQLAPAVVLHMVPACAQDAWTLMSTLRGIAERVVAISSLDVYQAYNRLLRIESGPPDPQPLTEEAPLRQLLYPFRSCEECNPHDTEALRWGDDYDKILVEKLVLSEPDLPGTILRLPEVYGPYDRQQRLLPYLKRMDDGRRAILLSEQQAGWRWSRAYVENIAHAIALAVTDARASQRIYNLAEPQAHSEAEWVRLIGAVAHWQGQVAVLPNDRLPPHLRLDYAWQHQLVADSSRIRNELGFSEIIPQDEGLRRSISWQRANPLVDPDPGRFDYAAEDKALEEARVLSQDIPG
jgi:nucleoside-diphosphate-sugar epimerase